MALHVKPGTEWSAVLSRASKRAPEAFGDDVLHNLIGGAWQPIGAPEMLTSPVDSSELMGLPTLNPEQASEAVRY
ncbi:MAG: aldehyde dehydrogenase, partial [Actinomycetota bacterium]|nr:aldehyde dehydrogenase [Actinomycetota bacterium]